MRLFLFGACAFAAAAAFAVPSGTSADAKRFREHGISFTNPVYRFTISSVRVRRTRSDKSRVRPLLHWMLFAAIAAATIITLVQIEDSESSTAGFGVIVVPLLLSVGVLTAAVFDRLTTAPSADAS